MWVTYTYIYIYTAGTTAKRKVKRPCAYKVQYKPMSNTGLAHTRLCIYIHIMYPPLMAHARALSVCNYIKFCNCGSVAYRT